MSIMSKEALIYSYVSRVADKIGMIARRVPKARGYSPW